MNGKRLCMCLCSLSIVTLMAEAQPLESAGLASVHVAVPPAIVLPVPDSVPDELQKPLSAAEAAQIALHRQPAQVAAQQNVKAAAARSVQSAAALWPSLAVTGGYTDTVQSPNGSTRSTDGFTTGVTMRQLLFDFERTRHLARQAAAQETAARAGLTRSQADLVQQVKQAYYAYAQALRLTTVAEANLRNRQEHLRAAQARVNSGAGLPIDVVRAETSVANAIQTLTNARNTEMVSRITLVTLMGLDARTPLTLDEQPEAVLEDADLSRLIDTALRRRPEIIQADASIRALRSGVQAARVAGAPSLVGSLGVGLRSDHFPPDQTTVTVGVALQWNLFDAGLTDGRTGEARANLAGATAQRDALLQAITAEVSQAWLTLRSAEQRVITAESEVSNAEEALRLAQGRYQAGVGVFLDVLDAQTSLVTAQTNRVNAISAINIARVALARACHLDPVLAPASKP